MSVPATTLPFPPKRRSISPLRTKENGGETDASFGEESESRPGDPHFPASAGNFDENPDTKNFSVKKIVDSIGDTSFGTSLMFFSIPGVLPIPGISHLVLIPTGTIAGQMIAGKKQIRLPKFILKRTVPRRSLSVAIHAILPLLEKAEQVVKPRWKWAHHPATQRILGVFVFLLAVAIAFPIPGFNIPQAISIFMIGMGLVEKDGLTILIGVLSGLASFLMLGGVLMGLLSFFGLRR